VNSALPTRVRHPGATPPAPGPRPRLREAPRLVRRLALATLIGNVTIVVTGAVVRLTSSGLGCPDWPRCTAESLTPTAEYGLHGAVEFGNRVLAGVLIMVVIATAIATVAQRPRRPALVGLAAAQLLGIFGQGVVGGITVLTGLNPYTVAAHFLLSMGLISIAYALWHRAGEGDGPRHFLVPRPLVWLVRALVATAALTIVAGTMVTGSGPHSGDKTAARTGFDPAMVSAIHSNLVFALIGLTVAAVFAVAMAGAPAALRHAVVVLLVVELVQGVIGYVQYFTGLPVILVGAHVLGACLLWLAVTRVLFATRVRPG